MFWTIRSTPSINQLIPDDADFLQETISVALETDEVTMISNESGSANAMLKTPKSKMKAQKRQNETTSSGTQEKKIRKSVGDNVSDQTNRTRSSSFDEV